jgi:hypothetical protein
MATDMREALDERRSLIEARADAVLDIALNDAASWTKALGTPPADQRRSAAWRRTARVVAAYRDRYLITDDTPLGAVPISTAQKIDAARTRAALEQARNLVTAEHQPGPTPRPVGPDRVGPSL